jgi:hypothetical protein
MKLIKSDIDRRLHQPQFASEILMTPKSKWDSRLYRTRQYLKWSWADTKRDLKSGNGVLASMACRQLLLLALVILFAIAKFGFGWF